MFSVRRMSVMFVRRLPSVAPLQRTDQHVMKQQDTPHHPAVFSTTSAIDQTCKRCLTIFRSVFVSSFEYLNIIYSILCKSKKVLK